MHVHIIPHKIVATSLAWHKHFHNCWADITRYSVFCCTCREQLPLPTSVLLDLKAVTSKPELSWLFQEMNITILCLEVADLSTFRWVVEILYQRPCIQILKLCALELNFHAITHSVRLVLWVTATNLTAKKPREVKQFTLHNSKAVKCSYSSFTWQRAYEIASYYVPGLQEPMPPHSCILAHEHQPYEVEPTAKRRSNTRKHKAHESFITEGHTETLSFSTEGQNIDRTPRFCSTKNSNHLD